MSTDDLAAHVDALGYGRALERADLPADDVLAASLLLLAGHPRLPAIADMLCSAADSLAVDPAALVSLCQAVVATKSPSLFGDAVIRLLDCGPVLAAYGRQLAVEQLAQAAAPAADASAQEVLRAADALEAATQLRVRGFASRFELFALLEAISGPAAAPWSRAATRAIVACVETWPEAAELAPSLERLAGTAAPEPAHSSPTQTNEQQESNFAAALARVEIVTALREDRREPALEHLERARRILGLAQSEDERPDIEVLAAITRLLSDLILNGVLTDISPVAALTAAVREHNWLSPGTSHWVGDRVAASNAAWAKLTRQLEATQEQLEQPSWYQAAAVIDDIVDLYRTSRSTRAFRREADDNAVRDVIAPMIETGFARKEGLLRHLNDHVDYLKERQAAGAARPQELEDLPVAIALRDAALERLRTGDAYPKSYAGDGATNGPSSTPTERVGQAVAARMATAAFTTGSLVADQMLETIRFGLAASPDYDSDVADAANLVSNLLVSFIYSREGMPSSARFYLFDPDASEDQLAEDLQDYLVGCGQLGIVRTEVRHIGGGRVDVAFAFPGFNLYVELKVDSTAKPLKDKIAYLRQTASYQTTDKRIGFLLVLKILKAKTVPAWIGDNVDVVEVADDSAGTRHIATLALSGGRTTPSGM